MIDLDLKGIQLGPNPAYSGESFILTVKVSGKPLRWVDIKDRTWNEVASKGWD